MQQPLPLNDYCSSPDLPFFVKSLTASIIADVIINSNRIVPLIYYKNKNSSKP